ncbi:SDR family oxidoreductase [Sinomicrobium kalidii]|uniref:SDR family oxidoreductase n=1 Tax=Sinomicrobium kalidii TaxID=2900738 RepID=UPI001E4CB38D|nr:SDR family oxidoreductase [Sinomicrobium kalidii]UGU14490.1 SDR family oxidoreductase [Sinomicrobium kalidii]
MKVFVTGATGFIGSAVVDELLSNGHQVLGLARSEASAKKLKAAGAEPVYGNLTDFESLKKGAQDADAVAHLGFIHDFTRFAEVCEIDRKVIESIGESLVGTTKPFIVTSGTGIIRKEGVVTEHDPVVATPNPRTATELAVNAVANKGVRASVVRFPPSVHGVGDTKGFVPIYIGIAGEKGMAAVVNEGRNVWPAVHRLDAAKVFRLALEKNPNPRTRYHAVTEQGVPMKDIAHLIAERLQIPFKNINEQEAEAYFAWFTHFAMFDNASSGEWTQQELNWKPGHPTLLEDLKSDVYFKEE